MGLFHSDVYLSGLINLRLQWGRCELTIIKMSINHFKKYISYLLNFLFDLESLEIK